MSLDGFAFCIRVRRVLIASSHSHGLYLPSIQQKSFGNTGRHQAIQSSRRCASCFFAASPARQPLFLDFATSACRAYCFDERINWIILAESWIIYFSSKQFIVWKFIDLFFHLQPSPYILGNSYNEHGSGCYPTATRNGAPYNFNILDCYRSYESEDWEKWWRLVIKSSAIYLESKGQWGQS